MSEFKFSDTIEKFSSLMDAYGKNPLTFSMDKIKSIGFHRIEQLNNGDYILFCHGAFVAQNKEKSLLIKRAMVRTGVKYV
jgi:hypothetical protein